MDNQRNNIEWVAHSEFGKYVYKSPFAWGGDNAGQIVLAHYRPHSLLWLALAYVIGILDECNCGYLNLLFGWFFSMRVCCVNRVHSARWIPWASRAWVGVATTTGGKRVAAKRAGEKHMQGSLTVLWWLPLCW